MSNVDMVIELNSGAMSLVATNRGFMLGLAATCGPVDAEARLEMSLAELEDVVAWLGDAASAVGGPRSLPEVLRSLRERRNLSQARLARLLGVERCAVSRWESGERIPSRTAIRRLVRLLRLSRVERWKLACAYVDAPVG
jgi:DNA-binding transcriptional regulator YiaG